MLRAGVDVGGTFTDIMLWDDADGRIVTHKLPSTPGDPARAMLDGLREITGPTGSGTRRSRPAPPRHDGGDEHRARAERLAGRDGDDRGLPRHHLRRPPPPALHVLDLPGSPLARAVARRAPPPDPRAGAHRRADRRGARAARRGRRPGRGARACATPGSRRSTVCFLFSFLDPAPRAARRRDPARGAARRVRLREPRGGAAPPRVRAVLDDVPQRVHRAEDDALSGPHARRDGGRGARHRLPPDGLERRHRDDRRRRRATRLAAPVRPGGRDRRRDPRRQAGRCRERDHPRRRRHVGRHRRRPGRAAADEAPVRHEHRRLRRDALDGRHGHDRRRRRLDRPHRRGRPDPGGPAERGRRPGARLLRPWRHRGDGDRRPGRARPAAAPRASSAGA